MYITQVKSEGFIHSFITVDYLHAKQAKNVNLYKYIPNRSYVTCKKGIYGISSLNVSEKFES